MALLADELRDARVDGNKQVIVGEDGDLELTSGVETVEQSVMLEASEVVRPLIGEPINGQIFERIQSELADVLNRDPQIETVNRVDIVEVDEGSSTVTVEVFTEFNNSFELDIVAT